MAHVESLKFFVLIAALCVVDSSSEFLYRKYEKQHPKRNYIQVVEIFETRLRPPLYSKNERDLNNFLARDAYKTDMNCTKEVEETTTTPEQVTRPVTWPPIPTSANRRQVTTPAAPVEHPTTIRSPNLNNLFTIRTKPTIRGNPRENSNPDYSNLDTNSTDWPKPNVQVTKHPRSTLPPTIVIQETDDHPSTNHTTLDDVDKDFKPLPTTTVSTTSTWFPPDDEEILYADSDLDEEIENMTKVYVEYDVITPGEIEPKRHPDEYSNNEDSDEPEDDEATYDDEEQRKRRRRQRSKRVSQKRRNTAERP